MTASQIVLAIWLLGVAIGLVWIAAGRFGLARVRRGATPLTTYDWRTILETEAMHAGVARPVALLSSPAVSMPVTWGVLSPVIVLPEASTTWTHELKRVVVMHEMAHIARRDSATQLLATFACVAYWIHPLVILAARRLRTECERACDERVLERGTPAADYAAHLLDVARFSRSFGAASIVSVAMAHPSQLEGRLLAVLRARPRRARTSARMGAAAALPATAMLIAISAFSPVVRVAQARTAVRVPPTTVRVSKALTPRSNALATALVTTRAGGHLAEPLTHVSTQSPAIANSTRLKPDSTFQKSVPVHTDGTLVLDLDTGGDVQITGSDQPTVSVSGSLGGRDWREATVDLDTSNGGARLLSRYVGSSGTQSFNNSFTIRVPRHFNVHVSSAGGSVSISGVQGTFTGTTGGGRIAIDHSRGEANLSTGVGEIHISNSHLDGGVATGGGIVQFDEVTGGIVGASGRSSRTANSLEFEWPDFSKMSSLSALDTATIARTRAQMERARVTMERAGARMEADGGREREREMLERSLETMNRHRGAIDSASVIMDRSRGAMDSALMQVELHRGDFERSAAAFAAVRKSLSASGNVSARTGGGNINSGPADGAAEASTGAGDVTMTMAAGKVHPVDVRSGTGNVELVLPRNANATLDLETAYTESFGKHTKIKSDWPLTVTETDSWDSSHGTPRKYVRVRQDIGRGGPLIRIRTVNGDIKLKQGS